MLRIAALMEGDATVLGLPPQNVPSPGGSATGSRRYLKLWGNRTKSGLRLNGRP
jgi:hypothetical protein